MVKKVVQNPPLMSSYSELSKQEQPSLSPQRYQLVLLDLHEILADRQAPVLGTITEQYKVIQQSHDMTKYVSENLKE
jgi:hypothetical protein